MTTNQGDDSAEMDSVAEMAGEYSEETLNMMRGFKKPEWLEEPSSLDPLEDMDDHITHGFRLPPTTYDAAREAAAEAVEDLNAAKSLRLTPDQQQMVEYRKGLVEGTSLDDVKLLKLRAYYRAMDQLRSQDPQSPTHQAFVKAMRVGNDNRALEMTDDYSEESEWAQDWNNSSYLNSHAARLELQRMFGNSDRDGANSDSATSPDPMAEFGDIMINGDPKKWQVWKPIHGYTPEYLEHQRLDRKLRDQRRQRALAFWMPLTIVLGAYTIKGIRRLFSKGGKGPRDKMRVKS